MRKRFIILMNPASTEKNDLLMQWIKDEGLGWWHWFQGSWLLSNSKGHLTATIVRDKLVEIFGPDHSLVMELRGKDDTWAGYGPSSPEKSMFKWIREAWRKDLK